MALNIGIVWLFMILPKHFKNKFNENGVTRMSRIMTFVPDQKSSVWSI